MQPRIVASMADRDVPQWPYEQAAQQLRDMIARGEIGPRLPSQMTLAEMLSIAPMTIQRALKALKDEGLVVSRAGLGTYVAGK